MKLKIFALRLDPATEKFDDRELTELTRIVNREWLD